MRVVYKALASVGMFALSAVVAVGIRHLVRKPKKDDVDASNSEVEQNESVENTDNNNTSDVELTEETEGDVEAEKNGAENETEETVETSTEG